MANEPSRWQKIGRILSIVALVVAALVVVAGVFGVGYQLPPSVLEAPIVLAIGGAFLKWVLDGTERKRAETQLKIADDRFREDTFQAYLDDMTELLLEHGLLRSAGDDENQSVEFDLANDMIRAIARMRTLTMLRALDGRRKGLLLQFLHDAGLIESKQVDLSKANLSEVVLPSGSLLRGARLFDAELKEAKLAQANLEEANLQYANLQGADLAWGKVQNAKLAWADLEGANLHKAKLEGASLAQANLQGADLSEAKFDETTKLPDPDPDHHYWTPDTDMKRFTDPGHPKFWRSNSPYSPAYRGEDDDD